MKAKPHAWLLAVAVTSTAVFPAQGQFPARPIRIIVPTSPGATADTISRLIAPSLSARLGQQVLVENRAGAATIIGTEAVARSAPDGYTLLMTPPSLVLNPFIYKKISYDPLRDFAPITQPYSQPNVLVAHPTLPARSIKALIALAKGRPGELAFASGGTGSMPHLSMELFVMMSRTSMLHVPYKGAGPAIIDLLAGRAAVMNLGFIAVSPYLRDGRLRALGVTSVRRAAVMPEVPTIAEAGLPGYEVVNWNGLLAPAGTPKEVIARLHRDVTAVLRAPAVSERIASDGAEVVAGTPDALAVYIRSEMTKWARVVKSAGIQQE
ncbi:MAG TPA: tripartite tricarboxylate transporter substrate binding protein [Burkholderiales bacterium]|nr:tripartite tricarboxylate transporter substrate binding protein [Burkholderiales bacterium]